MKFFWPYSSIRHGERTVDAVRASLEFLGECAVRISVNYFPNCCFL